ncbi:YfiR family protein [Thalassotalea euphylliae]|uniref:YfiR family protein n=1 Tax=Thalassotalea euphylliae TaxID=1655234 RepID=UPI0015F25331|nr:YfiR family protein [Thalassotalea euphylliae]
MLKKVGLACALALWSVSQSYANPKSVTEISTKHQVMAGFLLQLPSYVTWPDKSGNARICLVGKDVFGSYIDQVLAAKIDKGAAQNIRIDRVADGQDVSHCHLAFFSELPDTRYLAAQRGVLLVGEQQAFIDVGGMVNFYLERSRLRFEINLKTVTAQGLKMSSQLLKLAKITGR